ncbi:MAG: hypothetical protein ACRCSP_02970, partial [Rhodoglobus sp.]
IRKGAEAFKVPAGKGLPKFTEMMWDLDSGGFLRNWYKILSLSVHPTHDTVTSFLEAGESGNQLRHGPRAAIGGFALHTTALSAMLAYSLVEYIIDSVAAEALLEEPSNDLALPPFLHDSLPDLKRRVFTTTETGAEE